MLHLESRSDIFVLKSVQVTVQSVQCVVECIQVSFEQHGEYLLTPLSLVTVLTLEDL